MVQRTRVVERDRLRCEPGALADDSRVLVFELKAEENPMQHELVERPIVARDGFVEPLAGPGLGIDVRESVVEAYRF